MNGANDHLQNLKKLSSLYALHYKLLARNTSDWRIPSPALAASFLLHTVLLYLLLKPPLVHEFTKVITVELVHESPSNKNQIVSEPQNEKSLTPPPEVKLEAEENHIAHKEQIARGDPIVNPPSVQSPPEKASQQSSKSSTNKNSTQKQLTKNPEDKHQSQKKSNAAKQNKELIVPLSELGTITWKDGKPEQQREDSLFKTLQVGSTKPAPFSRPAGSGASLFGSADLLPHLPDGDMTFLNTKASQFAVFVRRVALSVFSEIKQLGWEQLSNREIRTIRDPVEIHAVLTSSGALETVILVSPSGSKSFDATISQAVRSGARDSNPPREAARHDGKFEFVFKARSWSQLSIDRHGGNFERRWLQLETGLE